MATDVATSVSNGIVNFASGSFTSDNTDTIVTVGFTPRWIKVVNTTDVIVWEKIAGMPAVNSVKTVTAGTTTMDAGSAIIFNSDRTMTLEAATVGNAKAISWVAMG
jgi:hypothetical protein